MGKLLKNKLIVGLLIALVIVILGISGVALVGFINEKNEEAFNQGVAAAEPLYFGSSEGDFKRPKKIPDLTPGRYYLNGDTDSYWFEIYEDNKIELCCDDKYALFEKWNPGKDDIIKEDVAVWEAPRDFDLFVTESGTVILALDWSYTDAGNLTNVVSGPCLIDDNTLGKWGIEGDFIRVEDAKSEE